MAPAIIALVVASNSFAQSALPPGVNMDQLRQQLGGQSPTAAVPGAVESQPTNVTLQPEVAVPADLPLSRLEQIYSTRAGAPLRLFGYSQLGVSRSSTVLQSGAVQDDYILGTGDELVISLRGTETTPDVRVAVDRNGQVLLPRLNPISAAGRTFGALRQDIDAAVRRAYVATTAFVSISRVRQISVLVSGEVNVPGQRLITAQTSVLDAILLSGGIKKTGSLRSVKVQRGGREFTIDLYSVLTDRGVNANLRLTDGDRIRVPLLGPTVAVTGMVRQAGIYELPANQRGISVGNLMALAGGEEVRGQYRLSVLRVGADGRSLLTALPDRNGTVGDSELLFVEPGADQLVNRATLTGGTGLAGSYPLTTGTRLSTMLKAPGALGASPYTLFGIIARRDPRTLLRTLTAFTPVAVLAGTEDIVLQGDDIVRVFSVDEARLLVNAVGDYQTKESSKQEALRNPLAVVDVSSPSNGGDDAVVNALQSNARTASDPAADRARALQAISGARNPQQESQAARDVASVAGRRGTLTSEFDEPENFTQLAVKLGVDPLVLINFLMDHRTTIGGAVRGPGVYIIGPTVLLPDLVMAAGGTLNWVDGSGVELISTSVDFINGRSATRRVQLPLAREAFSTYVVRPRDEFRFNPIFSDGQLGTVVVQGEVRFPGSFTLTRGERLSDVLARAGGLTNSAYPFGAIFLRKSVAAVERDGYMRMAKEVEDQLLTGMTRVGTNRIEPTAFNSMQFFVRDLRNQKPLGRVSIIADPSVLASRPEMDPLMEPDDVIYIPQRPSTVSVLGQVMQPGAFPYRNGETVADYIARAGGYARFADEGMTFVVLPDGTARKVERSWLRFEAASALPPGSAIVVPRELTPFDIRQTLIDVSQILSQFAVSVASLAVLSKQ